MGQKLRLAVIQFNVEAGNPERNYARAREWLDRAVGRTPKPDVILLAEMWNTGYDWNRMGEIADPEGERTKALFSAFCREHRVNAVAGSVAVKRSGGITNTIHVFGRDGAVLAEYSKIHLFRLMDEHKHLLPGDAPGRFELEGVPAGMMICYDIRFPELFRKIALSGAQIMFVPAEWPHPRLNHWRTLLMARAIENQMYVVACNNVGESGGASFFGHSMIVDPWGEIVAEAGEEETILEAEIDLGLVDEVRGRIPVFADRRPHLYG